MRFHGPEIAVIGAGLMGQWHAATARRLGGRVVAVVDPDGSRAAALAATHRARAMTGVDVLLAGPVPAVAHVCTPVATHDAICRALLDTGCHVMCEKPLVETVDQTRALLEHARLAGRLLCPVHQFTSQRGVQSTLRRLPALAPLRQISFTFCTAGADQMAGPQRDRLVLDVLPHPLSVLRRWLPNAPLADTAWHVDHPAPGELQVSGMVAGVAVSLLVSCSARPTEASATVRGAAGTALLDFFHGHASFDGPGVSRPRKALQPLTRPLRQVAAAGSNLARRALTWEPAYPGLRELVRTFYDAVAGRGTLPWDDGDILDIATARDVIGAAMGQPR